MRTGSEVPTTAPAKSKSRLWSLYIGLAGVWFGFLSCHHGVAAIDVESSPQHLFVLQGIRIEERREGDTMWSATASWGGGDMAVADMRDVVLTKQPHSPHEKPIAVHALSAHLALEAGEGSFTDFRIVGGAGEELHGLRADFNRRDDTLRAQAPVHLKVQGMTATGGDAALHIGLGTLQLQGPVTGQIRGLFSSQI